MLHKFVNPAEVLRAIRSLGKGYPLGSLLASHLPYRGEDLLGGVQDDAKIFGSLI
jgi:hypothetical protein